MPSRERVLHEQMKLRHGEEIKGEVEDLYPRVEEITQRTATANNANCTVGELQAATRYLTRALAEYKLRKRYGIRDSQFDHPMDEVYWREERALKGDWVALTGAPDGSKEQEAMKQIYGEPSAERIAQARATRAGHKSSIASFVPGIGGARYELANAIRHAWLICHHADKHISYGRQKSTSNDPAGRLHEFVNSAIEVMGVHVSADELHRHVQAIDQAIHVTRCPDSPTTTEQ